MGRSKKKLYKFVHGKHKIRVFLQPYIYTMAIELAQYFHNTYGIKLSYADTISLLLLLTPEEVVHAAALSVDRILETKRLRPVYLDDSAVERIYMAGFEEPAAVIEVLVAYYYGIMRRGSLHLALRTSVS